MVFCKDLCTPGSSMCLNNMLSVCDENGHLVTTDCPEDTECNKKGKKMACVPNTKEKSSKGNHDIMQQLLKLSKDKEFVKNLKKQLAKGDDEDTESANEEEEEDFTDEPSSVASEDEDSSDIVEEKKHPEPQNKKHNSKEKSKSKKNESQPKKKKRNKVKVVHENQNNKKNDNDKNDSNKNENEGQKIKTVTYHKVIENQKPAQTVTVYKTVTQKDTINKIDVQVVPAGDSKVSPYVQHPSAAGPQGNGYPAGEGHKPGQNGNETGAKPAGGNGNGAGAKPAGGNGNGAGAKPAGGNGNGAGAKPAGGNGNGAGDKPAGGNGNGGGAKPAGGNGGAKPAGGNGNGGGAKPAGGNGGGAKTPAPSDGGGASKPAQGGDAKPAQGGADKPAPGGAAKPAGDKKEGAAGGDKKEGGAGGYKKEGGASKPSGSIGKGGGNLDITSDQVFEAMSKQSFNPKQEYVDPVVKITNENFTDMNMAAMFLAQLAHESGGFEHIEEIDCAGSTKCAGQYGGDEGAPGKSYHGRGFIQLSWPANYKAAGEALGMGDELFNNPDSIIEDPELGAKVSLWFWKENVESAPGVSENKFGATTKAINGALECTGSNVDQSKKRYEIYKQLAEVLGVTDLADEGGCY